MLYYTWNVILHVEFYIKRGILYYTCNFILHVEFYITCGMLYYTWNVILDVEYYITCGMFCTFTISLSEVRVQGLLLLLLLVVVVVVPGIESQVYRQGYNLDCPMFESRHRNNFSFLQTVRTGAGAHPAAY
jgi:hypothetical protein